MKLTRKVGIRHITVGILVMCAVVTATLSFVVYSEGDTTGKYVGRIVELDEIKVSAVDARHAAENFIHHNDSAFLKKHYRFLQSALSTTKGLSDLRTKLGIAWNTDNEPAIADQINVIIERLEELQLLFRNVLNQNASVQVSCLHEDQSINAVFDEVIEDIEDLESLLQRAQMEDLGDARLAMLAQIMTCLLMVTIGLLYSVYLERQFRRSARRAKKLIHRLLQSKKRIREVRNQSQVTQFSSDYSAVGILWIDQNGKIVYANLAACKMTGYDVDELCRMTIGDVDTAMPPEKYAIMWTALRESGSIIVPTSVLTKRGDRRPVEMSANYLENNGEEYAIVTVRDVTDLELARQNLELSRQQYREVVDSVDVGIGLVDSNERFVFCNRKAEEIYGVPPGTLAGRSLAEFLHPAQFLVCQKETRKRVQGEKNEYDLEVMRPNGETRLIHLCARPRILDDGTFVGTFGVFEDITEHRRITEERTKLEDRLQRAEKMESLGLLAGGVAHDLNNMLGPLVGYPEMIIRKLPPDSPLINWLRKIEKSAELAADVIQDLLTLARRGRYQMKPTNVNDVLKEYVDSGTFARAIERNPGITFTLNLDPRIGRIDGSATHLTKTFMNIIQNALEATESGGSVSVSTSQRKLDCLSTGFETVDKGEYVAVRVVDTGSGIPAEEIAKIFEPYFSKKKMGASGSGLGLAVVYGVVKDHKGYYDVISEVGRGTEFILYFPVTAKPQELIVPTEVTGSLGELRVYVISDDPETRQLNVDMLQSGGITADSSGSGPTSRALLDSTYDCGIVDLHDKTACEIGPSLQEGGAGLNFALICLKTDEESLEDISTCKQCPVHILRKPCKPSAMVESVHAAVIRKRVAKLQKKLISDATSTPVRV